MNALFRIRIRRDMALLDLDPDPEETKLTKKRISRQGFRKMLFHLPGGFLRILPVAVGTYIMSVPYRYLVIFAV